MKRQAAWICIAFAVSLTCRAGEATPRQQDAPDRHTPVWKAFEWDKLAQELKASGHAWLPFLKVPSLDVGVYILAAGATDRQSPHERDEVYYIVKGKAILQVEGEDQPVQPGSIAFVAAKAKHHFHSISEELQVLVFFSSAEPKASAGDQR